MNDFPDDDLQSAERGEARPPSRLDQRAAERLAAWQQAEYVGLLARGASPAGACNALGVSLESVDATLEADRDFRRRVQQINVALGQNVVAALYRKAIEGNVAAQSFFLRQHPPPDWQAPHRSHLTDDDVEKLSDEELQELLLP